MIKIILQISQDSMRPVLRWNWK